MPTDTTVVIPLVDGGRLMLSDGQIAITDGSGRSIRAMPLEHISSVRRGGRDIYLTRRDADPVVITAASLANAQRCIEMLRQRDVHPPSTRWWNRQRQSRPR